MITPHALTWMTLQLFRQLTETEFVSVVSLVTAIGVALIGGTVTLIVQMAKSRSETKEAKNQLLANGYAAEEDKDDSIRDLLDKNLAMARSLISIQSSNSELVNQQFQMMKGEYNDRLAELSTTLAEVRDKVVTNTARLDLLQEGKA